MENHVHLIVYDPEHHVSRFMQMLGMTYAGYFNWKYQRTGPLFDGRFKSVPIESENYLLTAFRYVLNNPRKAGICSAAEYPWNSYSRFGNPNSFVDTSIFLDLLGSKEEYEMFISAEYDDDYPELEGIRRDDSWALQVIRETLNVPGGTALQSFDGKARDDALRLLKKKGLSIRQIERLTGINRNAIQRA
jgi:REP element-mobilizing transposase RayT